MEFINDKWRGWQVGLQYRQRSSRYHNTSWLEERAVEWEDLFYVSPNRPKNINDVRGKFGGRLKRGKRLRLDLSVAVTGWGEGEETGDGRERLQSTLCDLVDPRFFDFLVGFFSGFSAVSPPLPRSFLRVLCPGDTGVCLTPGYVA